MFGARAAPALLLCSLAWLGAAPLSCAPLPQFEAGDCGNRVVEEELEDCDGFAADTGAQCREPGTVGQCHFDCSRRPDGSRPECPAGWGCDAGDICRRATGEWETLREIDVGSASQLMSGDFDGDGRADLVSMEPAEGAGITRLKFHYFDSNALLSETRAFPLRVLAPLVGDLTDDTLSDVLFSDPRVGLLRGRSDRTWLPDAFSSYRIPDTALRVVSIWPGEVEGTSGFVVFATFAGQPGMFIADSNIAGMPRLLAPLPVPVESFVAEPVGGQLLEDLQLHPCRQVVLGLQGESRFWLLDPCTTRAGVTGPAWREQAEVTAIELVPPAVLDTAPLLTDLNGDQHLDVLIGAGGRAYVSYGDGQSLAPAVPYVPAVANASQPLLSVPMPLAAGDITGDGAPDFLLPDGIFLSRPSASGSGFDYAADELHAPGYWNRAVAADLNGNGKLDFIAASTEHPGIDFFNGTGTFNVNAFSVPTNRPVQYLVTGDFDGDLLQDLALSEADSPASAPDSVLVAYGAPFGPPRPPVPVARMSGIEQLSSVRDGVLDHVLVSSGQWTEDRHTAALAMLVSNGDRVPIASFDLTTFAADTSTDVSAAVRLATGGLLARGKGDVLALAFALDGEGLIDPVQGLQAWLLPALASVGTPERLTTHFDPELTPVLSANPNSPLSLSTLALDLDGDGRAEVVIAAPLAGGTRCSLAAFTVEPPELASRGSWVLDEPCSRVELSTLDGDADGALDLIVRTGPNPDGSGVLSLLWNDGKGGFQPERRTVLMSGAAASNSAPLAHAVLQASAARPLTLAVVNAEGLWLVSASQQAREFQAPEVFVSRTDCTGVAAADFNGDAAPDLAYAASGNITILKALLENR